ncbi:TIGR02206 family membrane protein [Actinomadura gamaensis]|uniref:TIGR02206 family membrane protein n=1 Tax=Actinomadura gamaensis TaxID=1763541 RepID=A0ABV9TYK4_9ACTN
MTSTVAGRFVAYGPSHWAALGVFAAGCVVLVLVGRAQRPTSVTSAGFGGEAKGFARGFALAIVYAVIGIQIYWMLPGQWSIGSSLPLELCDVAWPAVIVALWTLGWRGFALAYYWGLTLTVQALLTPALNAPDYPSINYLKFFGMHLLVIWAAVYLTWGLGMRPDWRSYRFAVAVTAGWAVAMLLFNSAAGSNYGFLNRKPDSGSVLDLMGPWPWYVLVEIAVIALGWALITWPWTRHRDRP